MSGHVKVGQVELGQVDESRQVKSGYIMSGQVKYLFEMNVYDSVRHIIMVSCLR